MSRVSPIKKCAKCGGQIDGNRKKFCCDSCKWWFNQIKKDKEKGMPPVKKRTANYFRMVTGVEPIRTKGAGKRCGGMIQGSMSATVWCTTEQIVPVNMENMRRHFEDNNLNLKYASLCDGSVITRRQYLKRFPWPSLNMSSEMEEIAMLAAHG